MLANMRDQVWTAVNTLTESEGMTFKDCLRVTLCIFPLLLQIPVDISYETQIPLIIAYCPESSVYRRWHPEQGRVSPFCKEVRASQTLTKVLGRVHAKIARGWTMLHLPSLKGLQDQAGHGAPELNHIAILKVPPHTAAGDQVPLQSLTTKDDKESSSRSEPSHAEEDTPSDDEYAEICGGDTEVLSNG